jgi:hypothetical protein
MSAYRIITDGQLPKVSHYYLEQAIADLDTKPTDHWAVISLEGQNRRSVWNQVQNIGRRKRLKIKTVTLGGEMFIKIMNPEIRRREVQRAAGTRASHIVRRDLA